MEGKSYFRLKEVESKKALMRDVKETYAKNQNFFKITQTSVFRLWCSKAKKRKIEKSELFRTCFGNKEKELSNRAAEIKLAIPLIYDKEIKADHN